MDFSSCIGQKGVIEEISDNKISVTITKTSACAECHVQSCAGTDHQNRRIIIHGTGSGYTPGEEVIVSMHKSLGRKATVLAYLIPVVVLFTLLLGLNKTGLAEPIIGVIVILGLSIYFLGLYFVRKQLGKIFKFTMHKTG
jgi:positive regulator of sigma E activity